MDLSAFSPLPPGEGFSSFATCTDPDPLDGARYSGAIRIAPSSRITEPFMKVFSAM